MLTANNIPLQSKQDLFRAVRHSRGRLVLQVLDVASEILAALPQVEHDIGDALAWAVIGVLAAAAGVVDGKAVGRSGPRSWRWCLR